ncbi:MAG: M15 family metallopeptidase [Oscillibacter sp.]|nr:M15 family metallopeptidase [Oscillibacter sp.]
MAFAFPPEDEMPAQPAPVYPLSSLVEPEPPSAPAPASVEPEIPSVPAVDKSVWNLTLVNTWNPLSRDYAFTPTELANGCKVDQRCYPDLQAMMDACRAEGLSPVICSAYRSYEKQEELYQKKVDKLAARGRSQSDAEAEAAKEVAVPGTSEHQLGLAMDIVDLNNQNLDESQENTAVQKWLMEHSWEYGFILRYPSGKSEVTGIIYEPWHYRYVGREAAAEIYEQGVCLEEYLAGE